MRCFVVSGLVFIALLYSCKPAVKQQVRVLLYPSVGAMPLVAASASKKSQLDWQLHFANPEEIGNISAIINNTDYDAVEMDIVSLMHYQKHNDEALALWSMQSPYALVLKNGLDSSRMDNIEIGVEEDTLSNVLLDIWYNDGAPLRKNIHGDDLRAKMLANGQIDGAILNESLLETFSNNDYQIIAPTQVKSDFYNVLVVVKKKDTSLLQAMMADYKQGIETYNTDNATYNALFTQLTGKKLKSVTMLPGYFFDVNAFVKLQTLLKQYNPTLETKNYEQLFYLPLSGLDREPN
jgi:hypothetical protein